MLRRPETTESLARNLRHLMRQNGLSEKALEKRSGVAQKTINNILNRVSSPTLDTVEKLAQSFGLTGWHLIMPSLPDDLVSSQSIEKLYKSYLNSSAEGRDHISRVAEREAHYGGGKSGQS